MNYDNEKMQEYLNDAYMGSGYVSECCSAPVINPGMCETGICSDCKEHCG